MSKQKEKPSNVAGNSPQKELRPKLQFDVRNIEQTLA